MGSEGSEGGAGKGGSGEPQTAARRGPPTLQDLKPHRCNDHLEAVIDALFDGPAFIPPAVRTFYRCLNSEPGQEPPLDRPQRPRGPRHRPV
mmetsp:Transcript_1697/g.4283  ORF Transcript_1697/g.4283 Transcript_1697/m.4283 type:complete len:91 (-) Transcript_1697:92-364(-)